MYLVTSNNANHDKLHTTYCLALVRVCIVKDLVKASLHVSGVHSIQNYPQDQQLNPWSKFKMSQTARNQPKETLLNEVGRDKRKRRLQQTKKKPR